MIFICRFFAFQCGFIIIGLIAKVVSTFVILFVFYSRSDGGEISIQVFGFYCLLVFLSHFLLSRLVFCRFLFGECMTLWCRFPIYVVYTLILVFLFAAFYSVLLFKFFPHLIVVCNEYCHFYVFVVCILNVVFRLCSSFLLSRLVFPFSIYKLILFSTFSPFSIVLQCYSFNTIFTLTVV